MAKEFNTDTEKNKDERKAKENNDEKEKLKFEKLNQAYSIKITVIIDNDENSKVSSHFVLDIDLQFKKQFEGNKICIKNREQHGCKINVTSLSVWCDVSLDDDNQDD